VPVSTAGFARNGVAVQSLSSIIPAVEVLYSTAMSNTNPTGCNDIPHSPYKNHQFYGMGQYNYSWKGAADIHFVLAHCRGISIRVGERRMRRRKPFCPSAGGCENGG